MPTAIDKIVDGFLFPTIPPIFGTPIYNTIAEGRAATTADRALAEALLHPTPTPFEIKATINSPPSKHSPAFYPTSLQVPQQILISRHRNPRLQSYSNQIILYLL